jgi:hypothetical protein
MKDAVKITVIATGFRDEDRPRRKTESTGFVVSTGADDFDPEPSSPSMVMESAPHGSGLSATQVASAPTASAEVVALDSMRNAMIANFEQADLDVPAFLRKRNDVV